MDPLFKASSENYILKVLGPETLAAQMTRLYHSAKLAIQLHHSHLEPSVLLYELYLTLQTQRQTSKICIKYLNSHLKEVVTKCFK